MTSKQLREVTLWETKQGSLIRQWKPVMYKNKRTSFMVAVGEGISMNKTAFSKTFPDAKALEIRGISIEIWNTYLKSGLSLEQFKNAYRGLITTKKFGI